MHEGGGRWVGSNKVVELKKKKKNWTWNNRLVSNRKRSYVKAVYCHPAYLTYMQSTS